MKVLAWVLGAFVVASLYEEVHCQCNGASWSQSTYSVEEGGNLDITAVLGSPLSSDLFLLWSTVEISAMGTVCACNYPSSKMDYPCNTCFI